ncbi:MAG TPA: hypothetical protein VF699_04775 [Caulobacteraceae bacterium]|jgi:hypothetical protein
MTFTSSRAAAAALIAVLAVGAPAAGPAFAQAKAGAAEQAKQIPVKKAFPYLDAYLKIPAAERSRFALAYRLQSKGGGAPGKIRVWVNQGGTRTELPVAADGQVLRLPTLAMLSDKAATISVDKASAAPLGIDMSLEPTARPAAEMSAAEIAAALDQANRGIKRAAGVVRFAVPTMAAATFRGAGSGEVVMADGRRSALPLVNGSPNFAPASAPGARTLVFAKTPTRIVLGPVPKPKKK